MYSQEYLLFVFNAEPGGFLCDARVDELIFDARGVAALLLCGARSRSKLEKYKVRAEDLPVTLISTHVQRYVCQAIKNDNKKPGEV